MQWLVRRKVLVFVAILCLASPAVYADNLLIRSRAAYQQGQVQDAIATVNEYIKANPLDGSGYLYKGIYVRQLGIMTNNAALLDNAIGLFDQAEKLVPDRENKIIAIGNIASTLIEKGDFHSALVEYSKCYKLSGRIFYKVRSAYVLARMGQTKAAVAAVSEIKVNQLKSADSPGNEGLTAYNIGLIYAQARQASKAVEWLEIAVKEGPGLHNEFLQRDTDLDPIRDTAKFKAFIAKYGTQ